MKRVEASVARQQFSDTLNTVAYGKRRVMLRRHGKDVAALVPVEDVKLIEECEDGSPPAAGRRRATSPRRASTRKGAAARPTRNTRRG